MSGFHAPFYEKEKLPHLPTDNKEIAKQTVDAIRINSSSLFTQHLK